MGPLGRRQPADWEHVDKFPLRALGQVIEEEGAEPVDLRPKHVPVVAGVNWYTAFDSPQPDGRGGFRIGNGPIGSIRGGHCVCFEPARDPSQKGGEVDNKVWWPFYDQGQEGACVGFGSSRAMSLMNRKRYQAFWLYRASQDLAGIPHSEDGSEVRAAMDVLRKQGHVVVKKQTRLQMDDYAISADTPSSAEGITAYRWARTVDEILAALGTPNAEFVTILNSWGEAYPERVKLGVNVLDRLLGEAGEFAVVTDR